MANFDELMQALAEFEVLHEDTARMNDELADALTGFQREICRIADRYKQPRRDILVASLHTYIDMIEAINWEVADLSESTLKLLPPTEREP